MKDVHSFKWVPCGFIALSLSLMIFPAHAVKRTVYTKPIKVYTVPHNGLMTPSLEEAKASTDIAGHAAVLPPYVITEISDWEGIPFQPDGDYLLYVQKGPLLYQRKFTAVSTENPNHVMKGGYGFDVWLQCPNGARSVGSREGGQPYGGGRNVDWNCAIDQEASTPQVCRAPKGGNPIDVFSGRKEERIRLIDGPVGVDLFYNSEEGWRPSFADALFDRSANRPNMVQNDCVFASFGGDRQLQYCFPRVRISELVDIDASPQADILYQQPDGSFAEFNATGRAVTAGVDIILEIRQSPVSKYILRKQHEQRAFDEDGRLVRVERTNGEGYDLTYLQPDGARINSSSPVCLRVSSGTGLPGQPSCITDRVTGRQTNLVYGPEGLIQVIDSAGAKYNISYNGPSAVLKQLRRDRNLVTRIEFPDGGVQLFGYNEEGRTGGADLPHALTSKSDTAGLPFATFTYSADGRATISEHPDGIGRTEVLPADPQTGAYSVIGPDGVVRSVTQRQVSYVLAPGLTGVAPLPEQNQQPAGAGCAAAWAMTRYSPQGFVNEHSDLNGSKTCISLNEQTMKESSRIEGLTFLDWCPGITTVPAGGRQISTEWHPRWHLATRVAEPRRITTSIYNGQPDPFSGNAIANCAPPDAKLIDGEPIAVLCKEVVQATMDSNGSMAFSAALQSDLPPRVKTWTYNAAGKVLTE